MWKGKNYNLVDLAYQQLDATYVQPVGNSTKMPMQQLSLSKTIKEPGYVYIYISNEGSVQQDIYFDDMNITHTKSKIIQADDYYPFGLTFNSYQRENSVINDFLYSGKEQQDELGLNWSDFGARMYMADIGRWGVVDPLTEKAMDWTPYRYAFNNPMVFIDPSGMEETYVKGGYGELISTSEVAAHSGAVLNASGDEVQSYSFVSNKTGKTIGSGNFTNNQINDWKDSQEKMNTDRMETIGKLENVRKAQQGGGDLWGTGSVPYNGTALGGTNFIGPGPDVDPRTLPMKPIDEIDRGAFYHDISYFENRTGGVMGALFNQSVKEADLALALSARSIIERYKAGTNNIDAVTGLPISERTYNLALGVWSVFAPITQVKYLRDGYLFPPGGLYNPPATPPTNFSVSLLLIPFYAP